MTHASLFSGIGGPEVAAAMMGWENAFHCEINPFGRAVLEYWFPESKSYEDITKTGFREWRGKIDILTGGFPCQPFSYAGKRRGREDDRYLWPEMLRVIDEVRPTWVVGENVAGITTMVEGGVLTPMGCDTTLFGEGDGLHRYELRQSFTIERICRDLEGLGYSVQPMLIPAAAVGAWHRRDRVFIIAHCGGARVESSRSCERSSTHKFESFTNSYCGGSGEVPTEIHSRFPDGDESIGDGSKRTTADSHGKGREKPQLSTREEDCEEVKATLDNRAFRPCIYGDASHAFRERLSAALQSRFYGKKERDGEGLSALIAAHNAWVEGTWWDNFPTVSPVFSRTHGLPFDVAGLTISFNKWRVESLKAIGNAIVPQVMYRIFQAIESVEE